MADAAIAPAGWRIEFTQEDLRPVAAEIAASISKTGSHVDDPAYKPPREPTLGTPEVIISIVVAAAAKALIVSGLHALEQVLSSQISNDKDQRVQVVVTESGGPKHRRFPISLQAISREAVQQFVSQIVSCVEQF